MLRIHIRTKYTLTRLPFDYLHQAFEPDMQILSPLLHEVSRNTQTEQIIISSVYRRSGAWPSAKI